MQKIFSGHKVAFLVANGFSEQDFVLGQKRIQALGGEARIISIDHGLVNSWNNGGWGLNFAADFALRETLAVDYSAVVVPGGRGSVDKLKTTAHTRRFLRGLHEAGKPVCVLGEAQDLIAFSEIPSDVLADESDVVADQNILFVKSGLVGTDQADALTGFLQDVFVEQEQSQAAQTVNVILENSSYASRSADSD